MASAIEKKPCAKCVKGAGVTTCDGCQQSFCIKHFGEHRQELSHLMDSIGQEHDLLQRDVNQEKTEHSLLSRINSWEVESITKIQVAAEAARSDLQELLHSNKKKLKKSVNKLTDELQACRESDDYTAMDINKWIQHLRTLRPELESPLTIYVAEDDAAQSSIRLIKVYNRQQLHHSADFTIGESNNQISSLVKSSSISHERFGAIDGQVTISEEGLVATCKSDSCFPVSNIYGCNRYLSGIHRILFRIERMRWDSLVLGIRASSKKIGRGNMHDTSFYGWRNIDTVVTNGTTRMSNNENVISRNNQMTLDCDNRHIHLEYPGAGRLERITVDLDRCPFPW